MILSAVLLHMEQLLNTGHFQMLGHFLERCGTVNYQDVLFQMHNVKGWA